MYLYQINTAKTKHCGKWNNITACSICVARTDPIYLDLESVVLVSYGLKRQETKLSFVAIIHTVRVLVFQLLSL